MRTLAMLAVLVGTTTLASAQSQAIYDRHGRFNGSATTHGNNTAFRDKNGHFTGSAITHGNTTTYYDRSGRYQGTITNRKER